MDLFSLALGTLGGVAAVRGLARVREHRVAPTGVADLVNWGFLVDDGVVLQKDGSLLAGWRYRGPDPSAATPEELDALSRHVNDALLPYTDTWMFHVDAIRRPAVAYAPSTFPDPLTQVLDDERRIVYANRACGAVVELHPSFGRGGLPVLLYGADGETGQRLAAPGAEAA